MHRIILICRRCSRTQSVPTTGEIGSKLEVLNESIGTDYRFAAEQSVHQYYGLCASCSTDEQTTRAEGRP